MNSQNISGATLRKFVTDYLTEVAYMPAGEFESGPYDSKTDGWGVVVIKGVKSMDTATFTITRLTPNGGRCSSVPVYDMWFNDEQIGYIADLAAENL